MARNGLHESTGSLRLGVVRQPEGSSAGCEGLMFADAATDRTLEAGAQKDAIRVERFGPTG